MPKIVSYKEKPITTNMLNATYSQLEKSLFFTQLFNAIGITHTYITNVYSSFYNSKNKGVLIKLKNDLNSKLVGVAKRFNDLFFKTDCYKFEFDFESEKIYFAIFKDGQAINLDRQSTGFKWFFNLYFNVLCDKNLSAGDILIMDEPATNLHVSGQIELRKTLKQFAMQNDITIIIATHSPFLIDLDYLDELRFISVENNEAKINNDFSSIDLENPDTLTPVKKALTVNNHILCSPVIKVVFVEGITDYNYMVAFKKLFNIEDVVFLPINGVGTEKSQQYEISKKLIEIGRRDPVLMVDGDEAGKAIKNLNKDSAMTVFTLSDVDESFKTIESLFGAEDAKRLGVVTEKGDFIKHSADSAVLKTHKLQQSGLSKQTEKNFKKLFDYIDNL